MNYEILLRKISDIENDNHRLRNEIDDLKRYVRDLNRNIELLNGEYQKSYYVIEKLLYYLSDKDSIFSPEDINYFNYLVSCL